MFRIEFTNGSRNTVSGIKSLKSEMRGLELFREDGFQIAINRKELTDAFIVGRVNVYRPGNDDEIFATVEEI